MVVSVGAWSLEPDVDRSALSAQREERVRAPTDLTKLERNQLMLSRFAIHSRFAAGTPE